MKSVFTTLSVAFICVLIGKQTIAQPPEDSSSLPQAFELQILETGLTDELQTEIEKAETEEDLLALTSSRNATWRESTSCTVLEGQSTRIMFGKTISLVTGVSQGRQGRVESRSRQQIGTGINALVKRVGDKFELKLSYQSARLESEQQDDMPPPGILTTTFDSTAVLELGQPKVLTTTPHSCLFVTISKQRERSSRSSRARSRN